MVSKLNQAWTSHVQGNETAKAEFETLVLNSRDVLERLEQLLLRDLEEVTRVESSTDAYEKPSWAYAQAHRNGVVSYIRKMLTLVKRT